MEPAPPTKIIRPAGPGDRDDWLKMRHQLWPDHANHEEDIRNYFARKKPNAGRVWLAFQGGQGIGFIEASIRDTAEGCLTSPVAYIEGWFVRKPWRQSGVGRSLLDTVETWAREQGLTELASDCTLDNTDSAASHGSCGFAETSRIITFKKELHSNRMEK